MTEHERQTAACTCCGHQYTHPVDIEDKAIMHCSQCGEYIHVRSGLPLGQTTENNGEPATGTEQAYRQPGKDGLPQRTSAPPAQRTEKNTAITNTARRTAGKPWPVVPILILLAALLPAAWIIITPGDKDTYIYAAKDGTFVLCWPYIRWGFATLLSLPCILCAVIVRTGRTNK